MKHSVSTLTAENHRTVLLCKDGDYVEDSDEWITPVANPIQCMSAATEDRYDLIVVSIASRSPGDIDQAIELCTLLNGNRHSRNCPVAVCLPWADRELIERLKRIGVDYVKIRTARSKSACKGEFLPSSDWIDEANRIDRVLSVLCPNIHYSPINENRALVTCRAYANWLVLGPRTLRKLCEISRHRTCSYYQSPKLEA